MLNRAVNYVKAHRLPFFIAFAVLVLAFPIIIPSNFVRGIAVRTVLYMLFASSLNLINGYCGHFSIGHAGFMCIGCYTAGLLATKAGLGFWLIVPISGIVTSLFGLLVFLPTNRLSGMYLSIVTLGFAEIVRIIVLNWTSLTNGPLGVKGIPSIKLFGLKLTSTTEYYYVILFLLVLSLFCMYRILHSRVGRAWMSIRENPDAACSLGVELAKYKAINFVVGAFFCGVAGCFMAFYYRYIDTTMFTIDESFNVLSMVIVGGMGTLVGPILGAFVINLITETFRFASEYRMLLYGILIILTMWIRPQGIAGASNSVLATKRMAKRVQSAAKAKRSEA